MRTLLQDRHNAQGGLARKDQDVNMKRHLAAALAFAAIGSVRAAEVAADAFPDAAAWRGVEFVSAAGKPTGARSSPTSSSPRRSRRSAERGVIGFIASCVDLVFPSHR